MALVLRLHLRPGGGSTGVGVAWLPTGQAYPGHAPNHSPPSCTSLLVAEPPGGWALLRV